MNQSTLELLDLINDISNLEEAFIDDGAII
jgi:hypothetical protein